jgi:hypothetical protein
MNIPYTRRQKIAFAVADCLRAAYIPVRRAALSPKIYMVAWALACMADNLELHVLRFP